MWWVHGSSPMICEGYMGAIPCGSYFICEGYMGAILYINDIWELSHDMWRIYMGAIPWYVKDTWELSNDMWRIYGSYFMICDGYMGAIPWYVKDMWELFHDAWRICGSYPMICEGYMGAIPWYVKDIWELFHNSIQLNDLEKCHNKNANTQPCSSDRSWCAKFI